MNWQIYQCSDPVCSFRFPTMAEEPRRRHCPRCAASTVCVETYPRRLPEESPGVAPPYSAPELLLFLDNLRSTYNVGSLFRTADGVGVAQIHLCGITPTPEHPKVAKTALGAETRVGWRYHRNALQAATELRSTGVHLWALEIHPQAQLLFETYPPRDRPLALIIGNEVAGVDPGLLDVSDRIVHLPMLGHKRSLNVASAAAVALYQLRFGTSSRSSNSFHG